MADRYDELTPTNLVATLRSLRRRWEAVIGAVRSDPDLFSRLDEPGPDRLGLGEITAVTAHQIATLSDAVIRLATHDDVELSPDVLTPAGPRTARPAVEVATETIASRADGLAAKLEHLPADDWMRTADVSGPSGASSGTVTLTDLVRATVRHGIEGLRAAERQRDWLVETTH